MACMPRPQKTSSDDLKWAVTWPLLINDGRPLVTSVGKDVANTAYDREGGQESFLSLDSSASVAADVPTFRSTYGDLLVVQGLFVGQRNT